jgi:hypothetical protein
VVYSLGSFDLFCVAHFLLFVSALVWRLVKVIVVPVVSVLVDGLVSRLFSHALFCYSLSLFLICRRSQQWKRHLITFLWTQGHALWKDRCASAHGPAADSLDKSSTRTRQTEQNLMIMAYASSPLILAIDRRIFDIPLEERLQGRTSDLAALTKTMHPHQHKH